MTVKIENLVAIDLGNGTTNYIAGNGKQGDFASLVLPGPSGSAALGSEFSKELFRTKDGKCYLVGDDCREEGAVTRSTDTSYYKSNEVRILFLKVLKEVGIKNPTIISGLPTEFFDAQHREFEETLKKWARDEGYNPENVRIIPQHAAPMFDPDLLDEEGNRIPPALIRTGKFGVIDIGQGTVDAGQLNNFKDSKHRFGESRGVSDIHKAILASLSAPEKLNEELQKRKAKRLPKDFQLDTQTNEYTMDTWIRNGYMPYKGERLDFEPISFPARKAFADNVLPRCISNIWGNTNFLEGLICAGGGASVLGLQLLKEYVTCKIYMAADPSRSIVRGYFRFGKLMFCSPRAAQ